MIRNYIHQIRDILRTISWLLNGKIGNPPHIIKQAIIKNYAIIFNKGVLVETGSFMGYMIFSQLHTFDEIYSVEIADYYYQRLLKIFKGSKKVKLVLGDSAEKLPSVLQEIKKDAIFWLDGHFSGGMTGQSKLGVSPVIFEVDLILKNRSNFKDIILIDDARLFGTDGYPTIDRLLEVFGDELKNYTWFVDDDVIRFIPKEISKI